MFLNLSEIKSSIQISDTHTFTDLSFEKSYSAVLVISDSNVFSFYGAELIDQLRPKIPFLFSIILEPNESSKNLENAALCWKKMHELGLDRHCLVIGFGGGMITDLAGFVAACYMRGVDVIHIPTTLMGMIDAAIGGKTGINLDSGKNMIGVFHQPKKILISIPYLQTLPKREFVSGLAEAVKYGIIKDPSLFKLLEENISVILEKDHNILLELIERCCRIKATIVQADEKDEGLRAILNLGHTFAHAIEAATDFKIYLHGEAVSIGLSYAFITSQLMGLINEKLTLRLHHLLEGMQLPIQRFSLPAKTILNFMYSDKKTTHHQLNLILIKKLGEVEKFLNVSPDLVLKALETV